MVGAKKRTVYNLDGMVGELLDGTVSSYSSHGSGGRRSNRGSGESDDQQEQ